MRSAGRAARRSSRSPTARPGEERRACDGAQSQEAGQSRSCRPRRRGRIRPSVARGSPYSAATSPVPEERSCKSTLARLGGVKHLHGSAQAAVGVPIEECLAFLAALESYPSWYGEVVREVNVLESSKADFRSGRRPSCTSRTDRLPGTSICSSPCGFAAPRWCSSDTCPAGRRAARRSTPRGSSTIAPVLICHSSSTRTCRCHRSSRWEVSATPLHPGHAGRGHEARVRILKRASTGEHGRARARLST